MSDMTNSIVKKSRNRRPGFSMIELVIVVVIIGIIAAIAIPRMSRGSVAAAESALRQNLAVLRNALDLYQTEHMKYPETAGSVTVEQLLTQFSNIEGTQVSATKDATNGIIYGPYIRTVPQIPIGLRKGSNGIGAADAAGIAWLYDGAAQTGVISANATGNDSSEKPYSGY